MTMNRLSKPLALITCLDERGRKIRIPITPPKVTIGKAPDNDLCLAEDETVSRHHCVIHVEGTELQVEDLGSRNGTYLENQRVDGRMIVPIESVLHVGRTRLVILPPEVDYDQETFTRSFYASKDSVIIPSTSFFEERQGAYLVADVVGSTKIMMTEGELFLIKRIAAMGMVLDQAMRAEEVPYLKCTGDGFLAGFSSADGALRAARDLVAAIEKRFEPPIKISLALHWGPARYRAEEGLIGEHIHAVFAVEDLRQFYPEIDAILEPTQTRALLLMTQSFADHLSDNHLPNLARIGDYPIATLNGLEPVYHWIGTWDCKEEI